jgi:hypothetical protein
LLLSENAKIKCKLQHFSLVMQLFLDFSHFSKVKTIFTPKKN